MNRTLLLTVLAAASPAMAQSLNVDIDRASGTGTGAPSLAYTAAAGQIGVWNSFYSSSSGAVSMLGLNGTTSGVTCTKQTGGSSSSSVAGGSADFGKLMWDYMDTTGQGSHVGVTLNGLDAGLYRVYVYAALPGSAGSWLDINNVTNYYDSDIVVKVGGNTAFSAFCGGGPVTPDVFAPGNDYVVGNVYVGNGAPAMDIESWTGYTNHEHAALSAFQVVKYTGNRLYVNVNATGANNGQTWYNAFKSLKDALDMAAVSNGQISEIWVAGGIYYPPGSQGSNSRTTSFKLVNGCTISGGFAGSETLLADRVPGAHPTYLSGAIWTGSASDNSYHVVTGSNTDATAVLQDVTITNGNANDGSAPGWNGGGLYILNGSPTIRNVTFSNNSGYDGGAVYAGGSSGPTFSGCFFTNNTAGWGGAGIMFSGPTGFFAPVLKVTNCEFLHNTASVGPGSGIHMDNGNTWIVNTVFNGGSAGEGGAVSAYNSTSAGLYNCTIAQNYAFVQGGGLYAQNSGTISARNSIVYFNTSGNAWQGLQYEQFNTQPGSTITFTYCDVATQSRYGVTGTGNINTDPLFINRGGLNNIAGDYDDDLRLHFTSPCVDAGSNNLCSIDFADVDMNGNTSERTPWDRAGQPRFVDQWSKTDTGVGPGAIVDMGALEAQNPLCPADIDDGSATGTRDGGVTIDDLLYYLSLFAAGDIRADVDDGSMTGTHDSGVTIDDLLYFLSHFAAGC